MEHSVVQHSMAGCINNRQKAVWESKIPWRILSRTYCFIPALLGFSFFSYPNTCAKYLKLSFCSSFLFLACATQHREGQADEQQQYVFREKSGEHISLFWAHSVMRGTIVPGSPDTLGTDAMWEVQKVELGVLLLWYLYSLISNMNH